MLPAVFVTAVQLVSCDLLTPNENDPSTIEITPAPISMGLGDTLVLQAVVKNRRGGVVEGAKVQWSSSDTEIVIASSDGSIRSRHTAGFARVRVESAGIYSEVPVAVGTIRYDNVLALAKDKFRVWGLSVVTPALTLDTVAMDTNTPRPPTRFISVVYGRTHVHWLALWPDGRIDTYLHNPLIPVTGEINVAIVIVDNGFTNLPELVHTKWQAAIDSVNADHRHWARVAGSETPFVTFRTTTIVAQPNELNPRDGRSLMDFLARRNVTYDIPAVVNAVPSGEISWYIRSGDDHFVHVGCQCLGWAQGTVLQLNDSIVHDLAFTLFHHEIGHAMGWAHPWGGGLRGTRLITNPAFFGWADVDGDGIIEAFDPNPYGAARWP